MTRTVADARADLDALIDSYLVGRFSFTEFQRTYSKRYVDDEADADFTSAEIDHYGAVHEKAEWTAVSPTQEDRSYGWIDPGEFRAWLEIHESHKPPQHD
jgi:hypothetical protein